MPTTRKVSLALVLTCALLRFVPGAGAQAHSCETPTCASYIWANSSNNTINGTATSECIYGFAGNDTLDGQGGADWIWGGTGTDTLYGGTGNDCLYGEAGNDYLDGENGFDYGDGGLDSDTCTSATEIAICP